MRVFCEGKAVLLCTESVGFESMRAQIPNALRDFDAHSDSNPTHCELGDATAERAALLQSAERVGRGSNPQKKSTRAQMAMAAAMYGGDVRRR